MAAPLLAQQAPQFTEIQRLTNREMALKLSAATGLNYRIEASTNLLQWNGWLTLLSTGTGLSQQTDSAAPFYIERYYRALQLTGTNLLTGDHLVTDDGDVIIHPVDHAGFVMNWNGKYIYNDPVSGSFAGIPKADLILISHSHSDHFSTSTLDAVRKTNSILIAPQAVFSAMTTAQRNLTVVMANNTTTNVLGLTVQAIPAYNSNHPLGTGNGYVLTIGGKRIFASGDTGNIAEMRALTNIDVAFVCINTPFTMTVPDATNAVRAFTPKVVYPYHYRNQDGTTGNAAQFKQQLGADAGVEVRLRKWY